MTDIPPLIPLLIIIGFALAGAVVAAVMYLIAIL